MPFFFRAPLLTPNSRKTATLIIKGLLGNLEYGPWQSVLSTLEPPGAPGLVSSAKPALLMGRGLRFRV